ncbi:hypothetical protein HK097_009680, partial [Rhizophlyctis rosea]
MDKINTATLSVSSSEPTPATAASSNTNTLSANLGLTMSTTQSIPSGHGAHTGAGASTNFTTASLFVGPGVGRVYEAGGFWKSGHVSSGPTTTSSAHVNSLGLARRLSSTPATCIGGPNTSLILRKSKSISFFVPLQPSTTTRPPIITPFRSIHTRPSPEDLARRLSIRQTRAHLRRSMHLHDVRLRLRRRAEHIRYRTLLQRQRDRLHALKVRAQSEYAVSAANLRRELILKTHVERCGKAVERAQTVAMMHKLKKFMELRRAFSENFKDLLGGEDEEEDYEMDELEVPVPTYRHSVSGGRGRHPNLRALRGELAALGTGDMVVDEDGQIERGSSPVRKSVSAPELRGLGDDEEDEEEEEDDEDEDMEVMETLADMIKRVKVLPLQLFENVPDDKYVSLVPLLPPNVTRFTLRELDMSETLASAQLRHDLYFDPDLKFKLNNDGDAWEVKMQRTNAFWEEVEEEVESRGEVWRVPLLIHEIKGCLRELMPYEEAKVEEVERRIDIALIKQEVEHGVLDVEGLVGYVGGIMKATCAPIRDGMVDAMVEEARQGRVIRALRTCFTVLELMRLDYANDQLHRIRPYVVEHAVDFEWRWFKTHVETQTTTIDKTRSWLEQALERYKSTSSTSTMTLTQQSFINLHSAALLHLILATPTLADPDAPPFPETLRMDTSRLIHLYNDWQDIVIMSCLLVLFRQACAGKCNASDLAKAKRDLWVLVNDPTTSMSHVSAHIVREAGEIRGRPFSEAESGVFAGIVSKTLVPESKIYGMMQERVGK